jgi:hypothetical protein
MSRMEDESERMSAGQGWLQPGRSVDGRRLCIGTERPGSSPA